MTDVSYIRKIWNFLSFSHLNLILEKGQVDKLLLSDIEIPEGYSARECYDEFRHAWNKQHSTTHTSSLNGKREEKDVSSIFSSAEELGAKKASFFDSNKDTDIPLLSAVDDDDDDDDDDHAIDDSNRVAVSAHRDNQSVPRFVYTIFRCILPYQLIATLFSYLQLACNVGKIFLAEMFFANLFNEDGTATFEKGMKITLCLFLVQWLGALCMEYANAMGTYSAAKTRSMVSVAVLKKTLKLSCTSGTRLSKGDIVTYMSTDPTKLRDAVRFLRDFWTCPAEISVYTALLYRFLGVSSFFGFLVLFFVAILNFFSAKILLDRRVIIMEKQEERMGLFTESLQSILAVKFFGWEKELYERLKAIRDIEVVNIRIFNYCIACIMTVLLSTNSMLALVCFVSYYLMGNELTASVVFPSIFLFSLFQAPLLHLPYTISVCSQAYASSRRLDEFMSHEEIHCSVTPPSSSDIAVSLHGTFGYCTRPSENDAESSLQDEKLNLSKEKEMKRKRGEGRERISKKPVIVKAVNGVDITIKKSSLVMIFGAVGAGKTTLLESILGEVEPLSRHSSVSHSGKLAYVPQNAWIRNNTLRNNIVLTDLASKVGVDEERYAEVLRCCALDVDLKELPSGDSTELGERGYNLSGGQKQRVSLARAVYSDRDIYLLDDPLSAVDAHVGKVLLEECICGVLKEKTRVLVTHHHEYVNRADYVYILKDGKVIREGSGEEIYEQLRSEEAREEDDEGLSVLLISSTNAGEQSSLNESGEGEWGWRGDGRGAERSLTLTYSDEVIEGRCGEEAGARASRAYSVQQIVEEMKDSGREEDDGGWRITEDEAVAVGRVKKEVYKVCVTSICYW